MLDLFSGIGGFALGLQRAGMRPVAFCESAPFARAVLRRHWPGCPCYPDIRRLTAARLCADGVPRPGLVCGGFPCQDVSAAGTGAGLDGGRSALWFEMLRLVQDLRPGWVVVENVPALRVRGADRVLAGLGEAGYACWPLVVGAAHAAAPHRRARVFVVAHAAGEGLEDRVGRAAEPAPGLPAERHGGWPAAPGLRRMADGLPGRLDGRDALIRAERIHALGNAVVPEVAEMIGRAIYAARDFTRSASHLRAVQEPLGVTAGPPRAQGPAVCGNRRFNCIHLSGQPVSPWHR